MTQKTRFFDGSSVLMGAGLLYQSSRDVALTTVSALTVPAPTGTTFNVSTTDSLLVNTGDLCCLATATNTFLAAEASTMAAIQSIIFGTVGWNITMSPAMGTPPTTAAGVKRVWTNRGATKGGVEFSLAAKGKALECDQSTVAVGWADQSKVVGIVAHLTEATMANLALAAGIKDPTTANILQFGAADSGRRDRFMVMGKGDGGLDRWFIIHDGRNNGAGIQKNPLSDQIVFDVNIQAIADTTMAAAVSVFDCLDA